MPDSERKSRLGLSSAAGSFLGPGGLGGAADIFRRGANAAVGLHPMSPRPGSNIGQQSPVGPYAGLDHGQLGHIEGQGALPVPSPFSGPSQSHVPGPTPVFGGQQMTESPLAGPFPMPVNPLERQAPGPAPGPYIGSVSPFAPPTAVQQALGQTQQGALPQPPASLSPNLAISGTNAMASSPAPGFPQGQPTAPGLYGQQVAANGLMDNTQAQGFQKANGYMPSKTVGGAWGKPTRNVDDLVARDQQIARQGNFRETTLGDINKLGFTPKASTKEQVSYEGQSVDGASMKGRLSASNPTDAAKLAENKAATDARRAAVAGKTRGPSPFQQRQQNAAATAQTALENRMAAANPTAYAQLQQGRGAQSLAKTQFEANTQLQKDRLGLQGRQIESNERIASGRNKTAENVARLRGGEAAAGTMPYAPIPAATAAGIPPAAHEGLADIAAKEGPKALRDHLVSKGTPPEKAAIITAEIVKRANPEKPRRQQSDIPLPGLALPMGM